MNAAKSHDGPFGEQTSEDCSTIRDNTGAVKNMAVQRPHLWTCKGQGLDMEHSISVLKSGQFDGHRWSCHLVVSLCVQCNHEDVQKLVKSKNKQSTET